MSSGTTLQALKRLTQLPDRASGDNGDLIAGQNYWDVYFTGGSVSNIDLTDVTITTDQVITSTVATGTAPFVVASTTEVANLHAASVTTNANLTGDITSVGNATTYNNSVPVDKGGTGGTTFTDSGVMLGNGSGALQTTTAGTAEQILTSNGTGVDPTFQENIAVNIMANDTGIEDHDDGIVTINADITKIDITACAYFLHGVRYTYAGGTALSPTIGGGDSSTWVGLDSSGLLYQGTRFLDAQLETIIPLARLQTVSGQSGSGSDLISPIDLRFLLGEQGWHDRIWLRNTHGVLFPSDGIDGLITESSTPLQVDQTSGTTFDAQRKEIAITGDSDLSAKASYHVSGSWTLQADATIVAPLFYDNQTDITALSVGKWAAHTILRAPKEEDQFILVYSQQDFNSQAEAEAIGAQYGLFVSQAASTLYPVANLIVKGNSTSIESIIDLRPKMSTTSGNVIGTATLQQIYDNSTTPEFITDATRGAITVKRGSAADTDNVYEGKNGADATTFEVDGNGDVTANSFTGDGSGLTGLVETGGGTGQSTYTAGDILYASASNTLSKLAKGSDDDVLTLASGIPSWAAAGGGGGTKEFIVHFLSNSGHATEVYNTAEGDFQLTGTGATEEISTNFFIPNDFTSLTEAIIMAVPDATETIQWDTVVDFASAGEASNANSDSETNVQLAVTNTIIAEMDISGSLTGIAADDYVGIQITSDTTQIKAACLRIKYT